MSNIDAVCRICRREGNKLYLKSERCYTPKCSFDRRSYVPGQHGIGRKKFTEYGIQLRAKQTLKRMYGLLEKTFRKYFKDADKRKGITGENLLIMLERRLDNIIYRLGFSSTRKEAKQLILHGHFLVNKHKVNISSYLVKVGDEITLKEKSRKIIKFKELNKNNSIPDWLEVDYNNFVGKIKNLPKRSDIMIPVDEQLIVELYSR